MIGAFFAVTAGAVAQSIAGIGFALVSAPFVIALLGPREGVRLVIVLGGLINLAMLLAEPRGIRLKEAALLGLPAMAAAPAIGWALRGSDPRALAIAAGALTIVAAAVLAHGIRSRHLGTPAAAVGAGIVSGGLTAVAGIGGPPALLYTINAGWPPEIVRPTLQLVFLAVNVTALAALGLPDVHPLLLVGIAGGWAAGTALSRRLSHEAVRLAALGVAAVGGVVAIARGIAG